MYKEEPKGDEDQTVPVFRKFDAAYSLAGMTELWKKIGHDESPSNTVRLVTVVKIVEGTMQYILRVMHDKRNLDTMSVYTFTFNDDSFKNQKLQHISTLTYVGPVSLMFKEPIEKLLEGYVNDIKLHGT